MPPVPTPGYAAGPASYALTLRQLHCYEASNREAFAALAYDPSRVALYGLIGQNMIALGHRQEGLDAFSLYFNAPDDGQTVPAPWDGDVYEMKRPIGASRQAARPAERADAYDFVAHGARRYGRRIPRPPAREAGPLSGALCPPGRTGRPVA